MDASSYLLVSKEKEITEKAFRAMDGRMAEVLCSLIMLLNAIIKKSHMVFCQEGQIDGIDKRMIEFVDE